MNDLREKIVAHHEIHMLRYKSFLLQDKIHCARRELKVIDSFIFVSIERVCRQLRGLSKAAIIELLGVDVKEIIITNEVAIAFANSTKKVSACFLPRVSRVGRVCCCRLRLRFTSNTPPTESGECPA